MIAENRSIRTLMINISQSIKLFLSIGEANTSEKGVGDDGLTEMNKRKKPQSVRMLSPNVMISSMQDIETKVMAILNKLLKDDFPDTAAYRREIDNNLNSMASSKQNNIRIGTRLGFSAVFPRICFVCARE